MIQIRKPGLLSHEICEMCRRHLLPVVHSLSLPTGITFHLVVGISMKCSRSVHIVDCTKDICTGHIPYHHNLPPSLFRQMTRTETLIFCIALRDDIRFTRGCHKDRKMSHYPIPGCAVDRKWFLTSLS